MQLQLSISHINVQEQQIASTKLTTFKLHILITSKEITQIQDIRIRSNTKSISATNMHK